MEIKEVFLIVTPIVTLIIGFFLKSFTISRSYKNEYYKLIIQKRINAYEDLEKIISLISDIETFSDYVKFKNFYQEFTKMFNTKFWFSSNLRKCLIDNYSSVEKINRDTMNEHEPVRIDYKMQEKMNIFMKDLRYNYFFDLSYLYKVGNFLKDKRLFDEWTGNPLKKNGKRRRK